MRSPTLPIYLKLNKPTKQEYKNKVENSQLWSESGYSRTIKLSWRG